MEFMLLMLFIVLFCIDAGLGLIALVVWALCGMPDLGTIQIWFQGLLT